MTPEEIQTYHAVMQKVEDGGNDGADIYEAIEFMRSMEAKYNLPFDMLKGSEWISHE